ncbi:hypothetical protein Athai_46730 [Actinocatenispora thailandica]|uniref:DUF4352 domain-containing protein n=1 Tax=Actinocatenispora thailandica TaxID=227318 RepID=A0A7R7DSP5_9ACTN|nr:FxLYD domain-containing protein [Actinocatenispora thailandica]BCJ37170.1 hypothetical protein Athai_46730 [Actinocatenispora thailandica]
MNQQPPSGPPPNGGQPYYVYPPQPPPKKHTARTVIITLSAVFVVLVGGIASCTALVVGGSGDDSGHTQVSGNGGTRADGSGKAQKPAAKKSHDPTKYGYWYDAKKDVAVDGVATGSFDQYVAFSVKNQSDTTLDYDVTFGEYNAQGERIGETYAVTESVQPGETVRGSDTDTMVDPGTKAVKVVAADAEPSS